MRTILSLGFLALGLPAAIADDHGDTFGTATMLPSGQVTIDGRIDTVSDFDWFGFTLTQQSRVLLYTVNPNPAIATTDTYAHLYDASGNYLGIWNNVDGAGDNFFITAQLSAGTYYLRVQEYFQDAIGNYRLYVHTAANAMPFAGPEQAGSVDLFGENQFYRINLARRQRVFLYTVNPNPAGVTLDTHAHLYDAAGNNLGTILQDGGAGTNFLFNEALDAGTYYLRVEEFGQDATGAYSLRMNHQDNATPIYTGSGQAAAIDPAGDHDFYKFTLYQADTINVETSGTTDTFANLYDGEGNFFGIYDNDQGAGGNFRLFLNLGAGTYYLRVIENGHDASGAYTLHVDLGAANSYPWYPFLDAANSQYNYWVNLGYYYEGLAYYYYYLYTAWSIYFFENGTIAHSFYWANRAWALFYYYHFIQQGDGNSATYWYNYYQYWAEYYYVLYS